MKRSAYISLPVFLGAALVLASCGGKNNTPPPPPPASVEVDTVREGAAAYHEEYPATVTALNEVELRPQVSGYITGIHFKDGQHVSQGQLLYTIDQQAYQAGVNQAQANLAVSKANLSKAQQDADRYTALDKKDAIAKQVLDHALADLESAKMQVRAAEAGVRSVQTNLKYSSIVAPFSGTIGISQVKLGASVSPGSTLLNTISTDDPVAVDFFLDQKDLPAFTALQNGKDGAKDSLFTILLADQTEYAATGTVASIDRAVDAQTGTIRVRLAFPNAAKQLRPGMSATVRVYHNGGEQAMLIPNKAVIEQMGEYFVYAVTDSNTVTQLKVKLGQAIGNQVIVKEGLQPGEKIVKEGLQRVKEGAKIQASDSATMAKQAKAAAAGKKG
ncbi:efflux RND transporter periplasmic adaptor subunit [Taibaiella koreensis]|uniref:efflux RND transporter periplasmic adaptor subunit n=1 Tax=Taibaiella koreensis TaxID=1268548 RepID=UPI000E5A04DA|nr:efflux RND transporter periplasmic adaptor subunit [Taibaiella koreensis]